MRLHSLCVSLDLLIFQAFPSTIFQRQCHAQHMTAVPPRYRHWRWWPFAAHRRGASLPTHSNAGPHAASAHDHQQRPPWEMPLRTLSGTLWGTSLGINVNQQMSSNVSDLPFSSDTWHVRWTPAVGTLFLAFFAHITPTCCPLSQTNCTEGTWNIYRFYRLRVATVPSYLWSMAHVKMTTPTVQGCPRSNVGSIS